jgi:multidrug efflux pump
VLQVRVQGQFNDLEQLKAMPIRSAAAQGAGAAQIRLGDIADIRRGYIDPAQVKVRTTDRDSKGKVSSQEVIVLGVSMAKGGDIIALGKALKEATAKIEKTLPLGAELEQIQDQPRAVAKSVNEFVAVLLWAFIAVAKMCLCSSAITSISAPVWWWASQFRWC